MSRFTVVVAAAAIALTAMASTTGCGVAPFISRPATGQPVPANAIVLGPNEQITLNARTAKRQQYICNNGAVLRCERLGAKLDCVCPGIVHSR